MHQPGKIEIVETLRGIAALLVCLYHFRLCNISFIGSTKLFADSMSVGWAGVQIFFVISGFIIPFAMSRAGYKIVDSGKFMLRRLVRIEPPYLISIGLVILLNYASNMAPGFKGVPYQFNLMQVISHIGYLPQHLGYNWLSPVYWSLESEFHFYIIIALIFPVLFSGKQDFMPE